MTSHDHEPTFEQYPKKEFPTPPATMFWKLEEVQEYETSEPYIKAALWSAGGKVQEAYVRTHSGEALTVEKFLKLVPAARDGFVKKAAEDIIKEMTDKMTISRVLNDISKRMNRREKVSDEDIPKEFRPNFDPAE